MDIDAAFLDRPCTPLPMSDSGNAGCQDSNTLQLKDTVRRAGNCSAHWSSPRYNSCSRAGSRAWVIAEYRNALLIIDFHAAHERILYDRLLQQHTDVLSQTLAFPVVVELGDDDYRLALESQELCAAAGIVYDDFDGNTVIVRAMPFSLSGLDVEETLSRLVAEISGGQEVSAEKSFCRNRLPCGPSCRGRLTGADLLYLRDILAEGGFDLRCPHGRPFVYALTREGLENIFAGLCSPSG
jgi:DNA mismatch repair protein MutL